MKKKGAREAALVIIHKTLEEGGYPNILLDNDVSSDRFSDEDRALITRLVYGVLENKLYLDWIIGKFSRIPEDRIDPRVRNIMRMSLFQLKFLDRVPGFAAVNEGVDLAKKYGGKGAAGFVNGILRNAIRHPEKTRIPPRSANPKEHISLKYSHPAWMVEDWLSLFGVDFTEELCRANNKKPDLTLRVNTLKTGRDELVSLLRKEGHDAGPGLYGKNSVVVKNGFFPGESKTFKDGLFYVQDESSMLAVEALAPEPGQLLIDVCSAPGGKCTYAAQIMRDKGSIVARDINEKKLSMIVENCARLGISIVKTEVFDSRKPDKELVGKADRVMVDAPCSGLGVIRRKPDIKWKKEREHYKALQEIQAEILGAAAQYLKPGGELVYSTCTVMPGENVEVVEKFAGSASNFEFVDISPYLPGELRGESAEKGYVQLFPNVHGTDGFFICKMRRTK